MDNHDSILNAALTLFSSHGYEAVGVQEIARTAGITKPTLYHYFGSKEGLLNELLGLYSDKLYRVLKKASDYEGDLPLTLINTAQAYIRFAEEYPEFYRLQLSLWFAPPGQLPCKSRDRVSRTAVSPYREHVPQSRQRPREYERKTSALRALLHRDDKHLYRDVIQEISAA